MNSLLSVIIAVLVLGMPDVAGAESWVGSKTPQDIKLGNAADQTTPSMVGVGRPPDTQAKMGMTWGVKNYQSPDSSMAFVGCHGLPLIGDQGCDAYNGDTVCSEQRPVLCLKKDGRPVPPGARCDSPGCWRNDRYTSWVEGVVALAPAVRGDALTSRAHADRYCAAQFGAGWRMAEHHDGSGWGWGFAAQGAIADAARFWVAIKNQSANCWDNKQEQKAVRDSEIAHEAPMLRMASGTVQIGNRKE